MAKSTLPMVRCQTVKLIHLDAAAWASLFHCLSPGLARSSTWTIPTGTDATTGAPILSSPLDKYPQGVYPYIEVSK